MSERAMVYDELSDICKNGERLIEWLQDLGMIGIFQGDCDRCEKGRII